MKIALDKVFCQNCRTQNAYENELCAKCGTRLMLVTSSSALRHEESGWRSAHEEHLLERLSLLENHFARLTGKVGEVLDLVLRQSNSLYLDHTLLETLIVMLCEAGQIDPRQLRDEWKRRSQETPAREEEDAVVRLRLLRERTRAEFKGSDSRAFTTLITRAWAELEKERIAAALPFLERAAALDPQHRLLNFMIGRLFFAQNKNGLAQAYLERAHKSAPDDARTCLLLALLEIERGGETEKTAMLLQRFLAGNEPSFAVCIALGLLAARKDEWKDALNCYKNALVLRPSCPEGEFLIACAYEARGYTRASMRYLERVAERAPHAAEVHYLYGLMLVRAGERAKAKAAFARAAQLEPRNTAYAAAHKNTPRRNAINPRDFVGDYKNRGGKSKNRRPFWCEAVANDALTITADF